MNHKTRTLCVWFLSLNTIILRFICAILCKAASLLAGDHWVHGMNVSQSVYLSPVDGHSGCLQFLSVT